MRVAHTNIAVRVTALPVAAALCRRNDDTQDTTSTKHAGRPPARSYMQVLRRCGDEVDYIVPGAVGPLARPTEIRDAVSGRVVRAG